MLINDVLQSYESQVDDCWLVAGGKSFSLGCRKWMVCLIELFFMFDRFPKHRVLLVSVFFMAATLALIPSCTNLAPLVAALAVMGFFMGNIDTIANLSMIQLYEVNVGPFLQVRHFFYVQVPVKTTESFALRIAHCYLSIIVICTMRNNVKTNCRHCTSSTAWARSWLR